MTICVRPIKCCTTMYLLDVRYRGVLCNLSQAVDPLSKSGVIFLLSNLTSEVVEGLIWSNFLPLKNKR